MFFVLTSNDGVFEKRSSERSQSYDARTHAYYVHRQIPSRSDYRLGQNRIARLLTLAVYCQTRRQITTIFRVALARLRFLPRKSWFNLICLFLLDRRVPQ